MRRAIPGIAIILAGFLSWTSCSKDFGEQSVDPGAFLPGKGVFIVNEGNFNQGNGSISFYSYGDTSIIHDVFRQANDRPLGDLPATMTIAGDRFYIAVNHSGRIETGNSDRLEATASLELSPSPRKFLVAGSGMVVVSDLQSPGITIFDAGTGEVQRFIETGRSSEALAMSGSRLFASNWSSFYVHSDNRYVMVIDLATGMVSDSLLTGLEPQSMVTDHLGRIWVLCSGGWDNSELPVLLCFDPLTLDVVRWLEFPDKARSPVHLCINPTLDTLYYIDTDIFRMPVNGTSLPAQAFISAESRDFYALGADPLKGDLFVSDALDFQQNGVVWRYDRQGELKQSFRAGIIPGSFCFN